MAIKQRKALAHARNDFPDSGEFAGEAFSCSSRHGRDIFRGTCENPCISLSVQEKEKLLNAPQDQVPRRLCLVRFLHPADARMSGMGLQVVDSVLKQLEDDLWPPVIKLIQRF